ncbi:CIC11C00000000794 [Sungouiella intermedia]|uniref:CIC11C00000000794 n=1 Tax=Sungouiella intermedia TaxID=45354 RepID=A0A1L0GMJ3_9ASCO|nr:CIC11C00000000794 [[Candida] intermedia]SGZ57349.1 CIC11C00000005179 [[Candida] intermedia]
MLRRLGLGVQCQFTRNASRNVAMKNEVHLSNRRVMRKIKMGKARPAIFHQFDTLVELSDGSVIKRRSQAPKDELRMINDQRNSPLWNPNRSDLVTADPNATGKVNKFKKRFSQFQAEEAEEKKSDDFVELMGHNVTEVQAGGKIHDKKKAKK